MSDATSSETPNVATLAAYAQRYAALGWHVLPLEPGKKQPCGRLVPRGMLDASIDHEVIAEWWRSVPDAGIGISLAQSGLVALDIDPRNGGAETWDDLQAKHGSLRSQVSALTGGGGEHHVFVVPPGVHVSLPGTLGPGVDVKANGYIVVEPSRHPSGTRYEWEASSSPLDGVVPSPLPDWLRNLRIAHAQPQREAATRPVDPRTAQEVREALYSLNADDRDDWLRAGMALHSTGWGHQAYAMWCAWSQLSDKFDAKDQDRVWASFRDTAGQTGLSIAWIFKRAQEAGWVNPRSRVAQAPVSEASAEPTDELLPPMDTAEAKPALQLLSISDVIEARKAQTWTVKRFIPADSVGMFFGGSGAFKSFLAVDLSMHVAHGLQWLGKKTTRGSVLYIAAEGGNGIGARIQAWHALHGLDYGNADMRLLCVPLDIMQDADALVDAANAQEMTPTLVVIDTMSQTFSGEENSATEVASYLRTIGAKLRARWKCAVLVIHHSGHSETERPRGSSALKSNIDWMFGIFRDGEQRVANFECLKQKDGEKPEPQTFSLEIERLGYDADGEEETSLVARHVKPGADAVEVAIRERDAGRPGNTSTLLSVAKDGMTDKELRAAFYEECSQTTPEAKKKAFQRIMKWAADNSILHIESGRVHIRRRI